ncbi:hypothetical protein [Nocardia sp. NPDC058666]|uniref:hypothetical protein n=1 Tax=Nocardia sp. NPDC058666 TaxID=3346587 RepID=UPI0036640F44
MTVSIAGAAVIGASSGWWWKEFGVPIGVVAASFYVLSMLTPITVAAAVALGITVPCSALVHTEAKRGRMAAAWSACILATLVTTALLWWATASASLYISLRTASWAGGVTSNVAEHYLWQDFDPSRFFWSAVQTSVVVAFVALAPLVVERRCGPADPATSLRRVRISAAAVLIVFGAAYAAVAVYQARVAPVYFGLS